jgi:hypothetical protein
MDVMSEQPKEELEEPFEPAVDPRFANERPEERKARGQRALKKLQAIWSPARPHRNNAKKSVTCCRKSSSTRLTSATGSTWASSANTSAAAD